MQPKRKIFCGHSIIAFFCGIVFIIISLIAVDINSTRAATEGDPAIFLVEIMPNPDGTDTKSNEFLKLKNGSSETLRIDNYKLCNINNDCYSLKGELTSGACLKIFRTDFIFILHNDKEEISLYDSENALINKVSLGAAPSGKVWLCSESYCEWGNKREECDYTDIIAPATDSTENQSQSENESEENNQSETEEENSSDNNNETAIDNKNEEGIPFPSLKDENENGNLNIQQNPNSNKNSGIANDSSLKIDSEKDWKKAKKEMNRKNLLSLTVDMRGKITVPYNIVKNNYFYILVSGKLVQVNIYASRQNEFKDNLLLYKNSATVKIKKGILKNNQETWQVGIGKNTQLEITENKDNNREIGLKPVSLKKINSNNIGQHEGKTIKITGSILKKSGQYFYVADEKNNGQPTTIYIPSVIWIRYSDKQNIGIFPTFVDGKIINATDLKGKILAVQGILETSGNTYRILVTDEKDISLINFGSKKTKNTSPKAKTDTGGGDQKPLSLSSPNAIDQSVNKTADREKKGSKPAATDSETGKTTGNRTNNDQEKKADQPSNEVNSESLISHKMAVLKIFLAQKMNWESIWGIVSTKITLTVKKLF